MDLRPWRPCLPQKRSSLTLPRWVPAVEKRFSENRRGGGPGATGRMEVYGWKCGESTDKPDSVPAAQGSSCLSAYLRSSAPRRARQAGIIGHRVEFDHPWM